MTDARAKRALARASEIVSKRALTRASGMIPLVRATACLERPADISWLCAFRVLFGLTLAVSMFRFLAYGWIDALFLAPRVHFTYWGFAWIEPLSPARTYALFWALAGLALMVAVGLCFRLAAILLVIGFTYLQLIDVTNYLNHYYLASLLGLLLALSPAHRAWSLDARLRPSLRVAHIAAGFQHLFRFQVGVVYTFAGLAKANADWLWHAQPLRIWLGSHTDLPLVGSLFTFEETAILMSWGGFLFDTTIPWWLSARRTRPYAYAAVIAFHCAVGALFPIGMFPVIMMVGALVFFPPDWPRTLLRALARRSPGTNVDARARASEPKLEASVQPLRRLQLALVAAYCALQLLIPLRSFAYGGDVRWHEQGMRFSWRVMVREKNGSITYVVRRKSDGRTWYVPPSRYLTAIQERELSGQPDLILQLAHHVQRDFERHGNGPVEVRVEALVSLNGRRSALLIDPRVDLTQVRDGFARASWILPAPIEPPPHIRPI